MENKAQVSPIRHRWIRVGLLCSSGILAFWGAHSGAVAQVVTVLTEDTLPAAESRQSVIGAPGEGVYFQFDFGFGTSELPTPGELHDSITLILSGFLDRRDRVLATLDVFGLIEKPLVEGAGDFSTTPVEFRNASLDPLTPFRLAQQQAFTLRFPLPPDWQGRGELTAFLASNGDVFKSVGFVSVPSLVPEQHLVGMTLVGLLLVAWTQRRSGKAVHD